MAIEKGSYTVHHAALIDRIPGGKRAKELVADVTSDAAVGAAVGAGIGFIGGGPAGAVIGGKVGAAIVGLTSLGENTGVGKRLRKIGGGKG